MENNDELQVQIQYALVEKLSSTNSRQAKLLALLDECIFECDQNFIVSYVNESWLNKLGYHTEELVGKQLTIFMNSRDTLLFTTYGCATLNGAQSRSIELQLTDNDGLTRWFELRLAYDGQAGLIGSFYDIQRYKDSQSLLTQQQEYAKRLSLVASHTSNLVIITDRCGLIEWVNHSFETLTGYSCSDVVGKSPGQLLQGPQSDSSARQVMSEAVKRGLPFQVETINYAKDGSVYWVAIDATPVCDELGEVKNFIAIETNITERVHAEAAMAEIEYNYHSVVDNIPDIVLRMDVDGRLLFINQAWQKQVQCQEQHCIGTPITDYIVADDINKIKTALYDYREGKRDIRRFDIRLINKQGRDYWVEITLTPVEGIYNHSLTSIAATLVDIQERVEAEQVLLEAKHHAEMLAESKSRFMANISHEIRTPLNAVIGSADILHDSGLTSEQMRYTQMIKTSGDALLSILDDVLTYSRFEAQALTLNNDTFRLDTCLEEGIDIVGGGAISKGLELVLDFYPDVPIFVIGDHARIRQIVINLLANAIKFTNSGTLTLKAQCNKKTDDSYTLVLSVIDTGIGIAEEKLQTMFEPFIQSDSSITRQHGGSGLGLAICRQICDAVGGTISVKSQLGQGSEFIVEYPLQIDQEKMNLAVCDTGQGKKPLVWVVGDKPLLNQAVEHMLERYQIGFVSMIQLADKFDVSQCPDAIVVTDPLFTIQTREHSKELFCSQTPCILSIDLLGKNSLHQKISDNEVTFNGAFKLSHLPRAIQILEEHLFHLGNQLSTSTELTSQITIKNSNEDKAYQGMRILVAEDNTNNQLVIKAYLEQQGCHVQIASDGQQAFELLQKESVDLVFMDIQMPVLDGISATKMIRSHNGICGQVPIIALTANAIHGDKERFIQAGMNDYLAKPIVPNLLFSILGKHLKSHADHTMSTKLTRLSAVWCSLQ